MKSESSMFRKGIVFGLTAVIFSFIWQDVPDLANAYMTSVRFAFFRMMALVSIAGVIIAWWGRRRFSFSFLDWMVLVYIIYIWDRNLIGDMVAYRVRLGILLLVLYFIFRLLASLHRQSLQLMLSVFMLAVVVEIIYGACQLYGGASSGHALYRLTGSFFNPGPYSCFLAVGLSVAFSRILHYRKRGSLNQKPRDWKTLELQAGLLLAWLCFAGAMTLLPATMSRSAWLAALAGCGVIAWQEGEFYRLGKRFLHYRRKAFWGVIAGILLMFIVAAGVYMIKKDSADGRLLIWKVSLLAMREHPWLGVGMGHFSGAYGQAQAEWFASGKATLQEENVAGTPEYGFNEYLQTGVELGGTGLVLFLSVLVIALRQLVRDPGKKGVAGGFVCWLVFACFSYPMSILPLCVTFVLLLALAATEPFEKAVRPGWVSIPLTLICLALTWANIPHGKQWQEAYASWREEQTYFNMKIYKGTVDNYAQLYPLLKEEPRFLFEYGQCLAKTEQYEESTRILKEATRLSGDPMFYNILGKNAQSMRFYAEAEAYFLQAARTVPNRMYPLYLLTCLYFDTAQTEKAGETARLLLEKEPKVASDAVREMKEEIERKLKEINS